MTAVAVELFTAALKQPAEKSIKYQSSGRWETATALEASVKAGLERGRTDRGGSFGSAWK